MQIIPRSNDSTATIQVGGNKQLVNSMESSAAFWFDFHVPVSPLSFSLQAFSEHGEVDRTDLPQQRVYGQ
jgi:hypothetical protein